MPNIYYLYNLLRFFSSLSSVPLCMCDVLMFVQMWGMHQKKNII